MARFEFRLPDIGEGIAEAEVVAWHVKIGDTIAEDQGIADMMTDKATVEMESPVSGIVVALAGEVGDMIPIGSTLVVIETEGEVEAPPSQPAHAEPVEAPSDPLAGTDLEAIPEQHMPETPVTHFIPEPHPDATEIHVQTPGAQALASPAVRARAKELGVDLAEVKAREGGRIRHADLDNYLTYNSAQGFAPAGQARADEAIKVVGMRRRIAENMAASKRALIIGNCGMLLQIATIISGSIVSFGRLPRLALRSARMASSAVTSISST